MVRGASAIYTMVREKLCPVVFFYGLFLLVCPSGLVWANTPLSDENNSHYRAVPVTGAAEHNIIRSALSSQSTLNNLGFFLNETYDFSQQPPPVQPLPNLQDSQVMQNSAAQHAESCVFDHISSPYGQNLFAGTGTSWTIEHAVNSWAYEARYYDFESDACAVAGQCGHYTQIVWKDSKDVGCVIQQCASINRLSGDVLFGGQSGVVIICHYNPPGNVISQKPYSPAENLPEVDLAVKAKVLLQGAYQVQDNLMRAVLTVPSTEPYSELGHIVSGTQQLNNHLLSNTGSNAIVDWVLIELRSASSPSQILESRAVLLQRDGDLVEPSNGNDVLKFPGRPIGDYHLAIRHRNHLGVMTQQPVALSAEPVTLDFSSTSTPVYGQSARYEALGKVFLWAGDTNHDGRIIGEGIANDVSQILQPVLLDSGNTTYAANYIARGYHNADLGMDGGVIFAGADNDTNFIRANVLLHPGNINASANFIILQQLP